MLNVTFDAIIDVVNDELEFEEADLTPQNQLQILKTWMEDYEVTPPRNRLERALADSVDRFITYHVKMHNLIPQNA